MAWISSAARDPYPYPAAEVGEPVLELPSILRAPELLDKALGRSAKATAKGRDREERTRNLAVAISDLEPLGILFDLVKAGAAC